MFKLTDFTSTRYLVKEEKTYFVIYKKPAFSFFLILIEKWMTKDKAIERMKELNESLLGDKKIPH